MMICLMGLSAVKAQNTPQFHDTPLDSILNDEWIPIDTIYSTKQMQQGAHLKKRPNSKNKESTSGYRIQLATVSEFELAEQQRAEFARHLGSSVEIVFDPPFYKLRYGLFPTKKEAESKIDELQTVGLQGFIIKAD